MNGLLDAVVLDVDAIFVQEGGLRLRSGVLGDLQVLGAAVRLGALLPPSGPGADQVRTLLAEAGAEQVLVTSSLTGLKGVEPSRVLHVGHARTQAEAAGVVSVPLEPRGLLATVQQWRDETAGRRFATAASGVGQPDATAAAAAAERHDRLTKPRGSLGRLEALGIQLAALAGTSPPPPPTPATVAVFAGDHGVLAERVTPWPQEVTTQMVVNFCRGGAAVNVLARQTGAEVVVVDVGVARSLPPAPALLPRKVRPGTANLAVEPAMTLAEAREALDVGVEVAQRCVGRGARCLVTGDMGIGNTTASAALIAALTGLSPARVTGRGTGIDDRMLHRKQVVVARALARTGPPHDPMRVLASVGGLEIAALAGFVVGGAAARVPVVIDGVVAAAALVVAAALAPDCVRWCIAGHRSTEPGAGAVLSHLGLQPLLDLQMRLGEGTGAILALPLLEAAARVLAEMATFDSAGVQAKPEG